MKRLFLLTLLVVAAAAVYAVVSLADGGTAEAHPGGTDANGCHVCRTNCTERYGIPYGYYHRHDPVRDCFVAAEPTPAPLDPEPTAAPPPIPNQQSPPSSDVAGAAQAPSAGFGPSDASGGTATWLVAGLVGAGLAWLTAGSAFKITRASHDRRTTRWPRMKPRR